MLCNAIKAPISPTINLESPDRAYLYRAIDQGQTEKAIQWINKWKDVSLTDPYDCSLVLSRCRQLNRTKIVKHLQENVAHCRT